MHPSHDAHRDAWFAKAAAIRRRVNLGWWLDCLAPPLLVMSLLGAATMLWIRSRVPGTDPILLVGAAGGGVLLVSLTCLAIARRRFESTEASLVRIEAAMGLRNALSTALSGHGPWPTLPPRVEGGLRWQPARAWIPPVASLLLLGAGTWIPIRTPAAPGAHSVNQPQAWAEIAAELDRLAEEEVVDPGYLEETRKRLDDLQAQPEEQWFSHHSLEATDHLQQSHQSEAQRLGRELDRAERALEAADPRTAPAAVATQETVLREFDQAVQAMQDGAMKPNPELLEQLRQAGANPLTSLSPEQLEQLRQTLAEHRDRLGPCEGDDKADAAAALAAIEGEGREGEREVGSGAPTRGPGHVLRPLGTPGEEFETGKAEALASGDLSHAATGDLLELADGEHELDRDATSPRSGGQAKASGKGGERVWRDALEPDEQRTVKRFFE